LATAPSSIEQVVYDDYSDGFPLPVSMYGGIWTENATQAVARDLPRHTLVEAEANNLPLILHTHDEPVAEVNGLPDLHRLEAIMRNPPTWAAGLPIAVEGYLTARYSKKPWNAQTATCGTPK
jgi:hypothetical protein